MKVSFGFLPLQMVSLNKKLILLLITAILFAVLAVVWRYSGSEMSCIFCRIVNKEINTEFLYEDQVRFAHSTGLPHLNFFVYISAIFSVQRHPAKCTVPLPCHPQETHHEHKCFSSSRGQTNGWVVVTAERWILGLNFALTSVVDMKKIMLDLLAKNNQTDINEIRLGFHVPPFHSVKHLHLHGIAPSSSMGLIGRLIFRSDSYWFKTVDTIIDSLKAETWLIFCRLLKFYIT